MMLGVYQTWRPEVDGFLGEWKFGTVSNGERARITTPALNIEATVVVYPGMERACLKRKAHDIDLDE
jgi:hypothetical protein